MVEKLILFRVNNQMYGINVEYVYAIESITDIVRVPNAPNYIEGIIHLRGEVVPVYSLRKKLNMPEKEVDTDSQFIVVRNKEQVFAFVVDGVDEIYEVKESSYMEPPKVLQSEATSYLEGVINVKGKLVLGINVHHLLNETEKAIIQQFVNGFSVEE